MGNYIGDRAQETTTTTGTGTINLAGAVATYQTCSQALGGASRSAEYVLLSGNGTDWEMGVGTVHAGTPNTWSRDTIVASSNANAAISLTGTSTIFLTPSASTLSRIPLFDNTVTPPLSGWTNFNITGTGSLTTNISTMTLVDTGANSLLLRGMYVAAPAPPYRIAVGMQYSGPIQGYGSALAGFSDGTKFHNLRMVYNGINWETWTTYSARASWTALSNVPASPISLAMQWIGLHDDGTNIYLEWSLDGVNFVTGYTVAKSSGYLGASGYTNVFWGICPESMTTTHYLTLRTWDTNGLNRVMP